MGHWLERRQLGGDNTAKHTESACGIDEHKGEFCAEFLLLQELEVKKLGQKVSFYIPTNIGLCNQNNNTRVNMIFLLYQRTGKS